MKFFIRIFFIVTVALLIVPQVSFAETLSPVGKYKAKQIVKVLIVPGHDDEFSGAMFHNTKEADLNLAVAEKLSTELKKDKLLSVTMSRTKTGYNPKLAEYFLNNEKTVQDFLTAKKAAMNDLTQSGTIEVTEQVPHANAPTKVAYQLYATNKWADEQGFDLIIHIHFNDYGSRTADNGEFTGYSVYVPDKALLNHERSFIIGTAIAKRLGSVWNTSNALTELKKIDDNGVIQDLNLIALGSNRTLNTPSILIEYSYMYESLLSETLFKTTSTAFAHATSVGLHDYLAGKKSTQKPFVYNFTASLSKLSTKQQPESLMLQYALSEQSFFPPEGKTRIDCPFSGIFDACTKSALKNYQKAKKLTPDGIFGKQTRTLLNKIF